jgi:NAD-specific glutamate dehydrogenase
VTAEITPLVVKALPTAKRRQLRAVSKVLVRRKLAKELAQDIARARFISDACSIWRLTEEAGLTAKQALVLYLATGDHTGLAQLLYDVDSSSHNLWVTSARASLRKEISATLIQLAVHAARQIVDRGMISHSSVGRVLDEQAEWVDLWALAHQIPSERDRLPAMVVLTTRLRERLKGNPESGPRRGKR